MGMHMMHDLKNCTFLIPYMNACPDREFNLKIILKYLNQNFKTNIIISEQVNQKINSIQLCNEDYSNLKIEHIKNNINNDNIHKTLLYNVGLSKIKTEVTITYDSDVLIPVQQLLESVDNIIKLNCDYSYPFNMEYVEIAKHYAEERNILLDTFNFDEFLLKLKNKPNISVGIFKNCPPGGCMVLKTSSYINIGMENELFVGYGPEDAERKIRLEILQYKNKNVNGHLFHIEHNVTKKRISNRYSVKIFDMIKKMSKQQIIDYYKNLNYRKKYGC